MISATHLHAMVIHFPVALLLAGFLFEIIALFYKKELFSQFAFFLLVLGTLGAIVAYLSGSSAGEGIEEGPLKKPVSLHETAATITLVLAIVLSVLRALVIYFKFNRPWVKWAGIVLFAVLAGSVARTGYLGGQLVYSHGAGVQLALPDFGNSSGEE